MMELCSTKQKSSSSVEQGSPSSSELESPTSTEEEPVSTFHKKTSDASQISVAQTDKYFSDTIPFASEDFLNLSSAQEHKTKEQLEDDVTESNLEVEEPPTSDNSSPSGKQKIPYFQIPKPNLDEFINDTAFGLNSSKTDEFQRNDFQIESSSNLIIFDIGNSNSPMDRFKSMFERQMHNAARASSSDDSDVHQLCVSKGSNRVNTCSYREQLMKQIVEEKIRNFTEKISEFISKSVSILKEGKYKFSDSSDSEEARSNCSEVTELMNEIHNESEFESLVQRRSKRCQKLEESSDDEVDAMDERNEPIKEDNSYRIVQDELHSNNQEDKSYLNLQNQAEKFIDVETSDSFDIPSYQQPSQSLIQLNDNEKMVNENEEPDIIVFPNCDTGENLPPISVFYSDRQKSLLNYTDDFLTQDVEEICSGDFIDNLSQDSSQEITGMRENITKDVKDFFDVEAELSGDEGCSEDESDNEYEDKTENDKIIQDENLPSNEELRSGIADLYMKEVMNDDFQLVELAKERFFNANLSDSTDRKRQFKWSQTEANLSTIFPDSDDEQDVIENENLPLNEDKTKWQLENEENSDEDFMSDLQKKPSLKIKIVGKQGSFDTEAGCSTTNTKKRKSGSLLSMNKAEAEQVLKRFKADETCGSVATTHMTFGAEQNKLIEGKMKELN